MPICIDIYDITGASADEIAHAHVKGRSLRDQYGGSYVRYLLNESREEVFAGRDEVEHLGDGLMAVFVSAEGFLQPGRAHAVAAEA